MVSGKLLTSSQIAIQLPKTKISGQLSNSPGPTSRKQLRQVLLPTTLPTIMHLELVTATFLSTTLQSPVVLLLNRCSTIPSSCSQRARLLHLMLSRLMRLESPGPLICSTNSRTSRRTFPQAKLGKTSNG